MIVAAILVALMLVACGSAPRTTGSTDRETSSHQRTAHDRSVRPAPQTAWAYPDGRILIIENRLEALRVVKPRYPEKAKLLHIEGLVEVTMLVDQNGDVVWACGRGDPALTSAAEEAARACKFPTNFGATKPGISGRTPVVLTFDFRLDEPR